MDDLKIPRLNFGMTTIGCTLEQGTFDNVGRHSW